MPYPAKSVPNRMAKLSRILVGPIIAALGLSLGTGCDSETSADGFRGKAFSFTDCAGQCRGELDGAEYQILLPEKWNGTLLIYSHGYRSAYPTPPDNAPVETAAEPAPGYPDRPAVADQLLARGFALAGSGFASNGWAVSDGVAAAKDLYRQFSDLVAKPQRVYLWGDSMGGFITTLLAEDKPAWVSGAAAMCAPMAGLVMNLDLGLDLAAAYATLLDPGFPLANYPSVEAVNAAFQRASTRIQDAAKGGGRDAAAVMAMASVVDAHPKTANFDARDAASRVAAAAEVSLIAMAFSTGARYEAEQRFGGPLSSNAGTDYSARLSQLDRAWIDKVGGTGTAASFIKKLDGAPVVQADAAAVKRATKAVVEGDVAVPMISVHTVADPLVIVQNQAVLAAAAAESGASGNLMQLFSSPPRRFAQDGPAPYGAGHCNFTNQTRVGVIDLLDDWVTTGARPSGEQVLSSVGESGIDLQYQPPSWPVSQPAD